MNRFEPAARISNHSPESAKQRLLDGVAAFAEANSVTEQIRDSKRAKSTATEYA